MNRLLALGLVSGLLVQLPAGAGTLSAVVVSVGDGDTIRVRVGTKVETVRFACINAPEIAQKPYGVAAKERLKQLLPQGSAIASSTARRAIALRTVERDRYNRMVAEVFFGGKSVNLQMVKEGQAVVYRQYLSNCNTSQKQYLAAEADAKRRKVGFWNQSTPTMPWDFRRGKRTAASVPQNKSCDPSYPDFCLPVGAADLDCPEIPYRRFRVIGSDPHGFDRDGDGVGCER